MVVAGTGTAALAAAAVGGLDPWSGSLAVLGLALLIVSTVLIHSWSTGPTVFLTAVVLQAAVAPSSSGVQVAALVLTIASYLWAVEWTQSGHDQPDRTWLSAQLWPLVTGAVIGVAIVGVVLVCLAGIGATITGWLAALAGVVAVLSAAGVIMLAGRRPTATIERH